MTQILHDMAELQPNIQMAQAVYRDQGPYADIRQTVEQISEKYFDDGTEDDEDIESDAAAEKGDEPNSDDQRCPRCQKSMPYHSLAFHINSCSEPVEDHFSDRETLISWDNTTVGPAGPEEQRYQPLPEIVESDMGDNLESAAKHEKQRYQPLSEIMKADTSDNLVSAAKPDKRRYQPLLDILRLLY